ncbi:MAG: serine protease [Verrucomicrobia bacterium]|nr:MAG: serine protease [Verrucomicrobiota bacterium]
MKLDIARQRLNTPAKPTNQARRPVVLRLEACPPRGQENAARFRSRIEFLCRMMTDRTSRLTFAITSVFASSLIFYFAIAAALAAPAEPSPPPVTPTPEAKPSPVVVLSPPAATPSKAVENSVVKIFATLRQPDPSKPWTKKEPTEITASGAVISGKRILTNAHVVQYASEVQVQANQAGDKLPASVKAVAPGMDLAVLELEDQKFFDSHSPLPFKKSLPDSKEPVMVYGYPTGGASLSITKGIISRIEFTGYSLSTLGLRIQIDAAINPGNSGGPAIVNDEIVGLAFSHLQMAQNIGYIIPVEEIELFLQDIADGHYDGKPTMYDDLQTLENPALRSYLHLPEALQGMLVHRPFDSAASYPLKECKIGDTLRIRFPYLVQKLAVKDTVPLTIFRGGKEMRINLPVLRQRPLVIPELRGNYPSYFVYGPMVFSEATTDLLAIAQKNRETSAIIGLLTYVGSPLIARIGDKPAFPDERLVVVPCPFFPHRLSKGYGNPAWQVLKTVNHQSIKNLNHLVEVLRDLKDEFVTFEFNTRSGGESFVFPRAEMVIATENILNDNGVRSQGSADVMKSWSAKPTDH